MDNTPLAIEARSQGKVFFVDCFGDFVSQSSGVLGEVEKALDRGIIDVLLDFRRLTKFTKPGFCELLDCIKAVNRHAGQLRLLTRDSGVVFERLKMMGLWNSKNLRHFPDEPSAMDSFRLQLCPKYSLVGNRATIHLAIQEWEPYPITLNQVINACFKEGASEICLKFKDSNWPRFVFWSGCAHLVSAFIAVEQHQSIQQERGGALGLKDLPPEVHTTLEAAGYLDKFRLL